MCDKESYKEGLLKQVSYGKFKVEFCYFDEEDVDPTNMPGYAAPDKKKCVESEFTIKEKSALDPRCSEIVKIIGNCDAEVQGYHFDLDTEECVAVNGSGCSIETPFETLEECQEVCEKNKCAKADEPINYPVGASKVLPDICCEGLKGISAYIIENDECEIITGGSFLICMPCGNGICETINSFRENKCNCPEDCK